jgi:uncharacterized membrane protein
MRYEEWVSREAVDWVREGLVSEAQAEAIRRRYREHGAPSRRNRVVQTLATIGAVVAGLGVVLFFAANWDGIPRPVRVLMLLALVIGSYAGGFVLRERGRNQYVGAALLLLGGLAFGASLFLVGQMYHVQAHDPLAFLVLALGAGATAWIARSEALATLAILSGGAWAVFEAAVGGPGEDVDQIVYLPVVSALYGALLYGLGTGFGPTIDSFARPARRLGALLAIAGAFVFTFRFGFDEQDEIGRLLVTVLVVLAVAAVAGAAAILRSRRPTASYEAGALSAAAVLVVLWVLVPEAPVNGDPIVYPILFNVLVAAIVLGAVVVGFLNDEQWLVTLGLVWVGIDVLARYLDLFWDMLPRSLVFVGVGGTILLLAFVLERQRRGLVQRMEAR